MRWDPAQYGRFANERNRAFLDLTARIMAIAPRHVVDIGCGPGYLTGLLARRWPDARVEGIDSSPEMIAAAADVPGVSFSVGDAAAWQPNADVDVVVSNAALQWVPHHQELMSRWARTLPSDGWLAVQVPGNFDAPGYTLMRSLASSQRWARELHSAVDHRNWAGTVDSYADALLDAGMVADVWETTYRHVLAGEDPVLEWMRGTALRPLLAVLTPNDAEEFTAELKAELRHAYPAGPRGTLFDFRRVFAVGHQQ
ncbi:trans-aconitate 2-methyltransferase [Mycobacterium decipiens]|uniref:Trans-aconitate methyltransferase n=1 Tax=Mycobacterium decipiens TaxID=1430326 RepID=A0A1X2M0A8_9MYCO|nr:trans-aconitate 2-methyltransferase [Mycobacterium decipiens]OSC42976.1 trans-aconitate methyltransferase [Mycobacterium decipiens]